MTSALGLLADTTTRSVTMRPATPTSCAATITFRTNGDRDDQSSFIVPAVMTLPPSALLGDCSLANEGGTNHG
jgi:hypothetical protein